MLSIVLIVCTGVCKAIHGPLLTSVWFPLGSTSLSVVCTAADPFVLPGFRKFAIPLLLVANDILLSVRPAPKCPSSLLILTTSLLQFTPGRPGRIAGICSLGSAPYVTPYRRKHGEPTPYKTPYGPPLRCNIIDNMWNRDGSEVPSRLTRSWPWYVG